MNRKAVLTRHPSLNLNRRRPFLERQSHWRSPSRSRIAELAGETTAECVAVCCCCPCGLMNLLVLTVYKLPAGLCRKALRKRKLRMLKNVGLLPQQRGCTCGYDETDHLQICPMSMDEWLPMVDNKSDDSEKEVLELEKEMWKRFYSTGFWRSPSQRE
ncbi:PREDICTED: uncharacterized protein LOC104607031 [Nelumbo nucifera]|uniref:Uncharacterized protein n=2 Tax=Nelumbo nucifera TaxID=4432 RepID=A0A822YJ68_NELNU|nr:PREDICTED: uncharacterized protein LOC104607031 [Nelumbo nucifera]DAD32567.1 TPA_asm: hypothetical protein HUJ06_011418 [Nelumbo nucifera]